MKVLHICQKKKNELERFLAIIAFIVGQLVRMQKSNLERF